jgi:hypothetical protein
VLLHSKRGAAGLFVGLTFLLIVITLRISIELTIPRFRRGPAYDQFVISETEEGTYLRVWWVGVFPVHSPIQESPSARTHGAGRARTWRIYESQASEGTANYIPGSASLNDGRLGTWRQIPQHSDHRDNFRGKQGLGVTSRGITWWGRRLGKGGVTKHLILAFSADLSEISVIGCRKPGPPDTDIPSTPCLGVNFLSGMVPILYITGSVVFISNSALTLKSSGYVRD